jgi:diadenosine tetraphosphate (Ap4A) HIT family hydrolase
VRCVTDWRADRIGSALTGANPTVLRRLPGGFAVLGDPQWLPGYCVLLTDDPAIERLSDLPWPARSAYLHSLAVLAEAVEMACKAADDAFRRVNIEILGNTDPYLHAHVWPRYDWEPPELVGSPVWVYPRERWHDESTALGPQHDDLRAAIIRELA